jgi:hypothetical protein
MLLCQRVKAVTHVIKLLSFVQDRIRRHGYTAFFEKLTRESSRWADWPLCRIGGTIELRSGGLQNEAFN